MSNRKLLLGLAVALSFMGVAVGAWALQSTFLGLATAAVGACVLALTLSPIRDASSRAKRVEESATSRVKSEARKPEDNLARFDHCGELVCQMVREGRYALLLRKEIVENLDPAEQAVTVGELEENMGLVPQGRVMMEPWRLNQGGELDEGRTLIDVEPLYLDRHPVTNVEYQAFVDAGGYEQPTLWDPELLPAVLEFVDQTGHPGPRFWEEGKFPTEKADHPVVGICWYEAEAYARWVGKRLPTSPEWVKAGSWPVEAGGPKPKQRKFPWGDAMDRQKANLWGSSVAGTCSVHDFTEGSSVNGLQQLIGNVWEWTTTSFVPKDETGRPLDLVTPMKTIRGGAFDTYFDNQASCHFQSGDTLMARKHNIGFRCALSYCDVCFPDEQEHVCEEELMTV